MQRSCTIFRSLIVLFCVGTGLALLSLKLEGQAVSGDLVGNVTDTTGATVPDATITVTNIATEVQTSVRSDRKGLYRLANLLPGDYKISATAGGFATFNITNVPVVLNQTGNGEYYADGRSSIHVGRRRCKHHC